METAEPEIRIKLSDFDYALPAGLIAQHPVAPRDAARMMVVDRRRGEIHHRIFRHLPEYLRPDDVLVVNNTRVVPARLRASRPGGGAVELLLLREGEDGRWEALVRPGRRARPGTRLRIGDRASAEVVEARPDGVRILRLTADRPIREWLQEAGEMPLPPYITEPLRRPDDYQTVYAAVDGAVAAPTAGLHFTPALLDRIRGMGVGVVMLTLHIGPGTFRPVRAEEIERHEMEAEWYDIGEAAAAAVGGAKARGGRVIAVGTSTVRALETAASETGEVRAGRGWSRLFIYPGYVFRATDALVTNFHLPRTTLLMLVSAFAGRELILRAYAQAVEKRYRFYSFGDAMLIL